MGCREVCAKIPARNLIVLMVFLTTYINYTTRSNMSISLPAMVLLGKKGTKPECIQEEESNEQSNKTVVEEDTGTKYDWDQGIQGQILGAYFYGYLIGSLPAGIISEWMGPFKTIFWATLVAAILNSVCAVVAGLHWAALFVCRLIIGITGGLVYPALQCLIGRWAPPQERGKFVSGLMGNTLGTSLTWILVGSLTKAYGWPWGFHFLSIQCAVYLVVCFFLLADSPETHKWITAEELDFIKTSQEGKVSKTKAVPPYKKILTSFPFWTLAILHFGNLWGLYIQLTGIPKFMKEYIGYDIKNSGFLSSLPNLLRFFFGIGYGILGDYLKKKKYRRVLILKSFILFSHLIPGVLMAFMALAGCNSAVAVTLLTISMAVNGAAVMTNLSNATDLSPNFAGTIFGIISFTGGTTGFIVPALTGYIISVFGNSTKAWSLVFVLGGTIYFVTGVFFMIFGSGDIQSWNEKAQDEAEDEADKSTK